MKFGGTSVGAIEKIKNVAHRVHGLREAGEECAVVVSAMAGETDRLLELAAEVTDHPEPHELDVLLATGEQKSVALLAMALHQHGLRAETFYGHRVGLATDDSHTKAQIRSADVQRIRKSLSSGAVPVIAGFQGVAPDGDITTLGRGGSDTTAVAYAAALGCSCDIYTDVKGIYTADPRVVQEARLLSEISYDEIIELSSSGAKVMETRSVILAKRFRVPLTIRSSHEEGGGTLVTEAPANTGPVASVTASLKEVRFTVTGLPASIGVQAELFEELAERNILVDLFVQDASSGAGTTFAFTSLENEFYNVAKVTRAFAQRHGGRMLDPVFSLAKVSAVGAGMNDTPGVAAKFFGALSEAGINIKMINCADLKISVLLPKDQAADALNALHSAFSLGR